MNKQGRRMLLAALWLALVLAVSRPVAAQATLIFTLQNPAPTVIPGGVFQFVATLQTATRSTRSR